MRLRLAVLAVVPAVVFGFVAAVPAQASGTTVHVHRGQSIQAAVDKAAPGTTIVLDEGTYWQSVLIRKDGITIRGQGDGTVIAPPKVLPKNICTTNFLGGKGAAFCVFAKRLDAKQNVVTRVLNTKISDLQVRGFNGMGIVAFGGSGFVVHDVTAVNDGDYGIARFDTVGGAVYDNVVRRNGEAGIYVGDTAMANAVVHDNQATGNQLGVFVRHSRYVKVYDNTSWGNCQGLLILDDGQPGGAGNVTAWDNDLNRNNMFCTANAEHPPLQGGGLLVLGGTKNVLRDNEVNGNVGKQFNSGGIVLISAQMFHGANAAWNTVTGNDATGNSPADIRWDGKGAGNRFTDNDCHTSMPAGLCN
ncbi:right-handed parallel beta-helix repeat-containing protein [Kribbella sp.]|uniref:right-handed parallel beta-helix repeat-containing protein n=1 Tax=Kribbella sp. TaxID=1871183 RepID=UPI002D573EBC|nr:right-handed parallel beta-helix repeat-containing protein [Kribbella sp.]HZX05918.1 right-handed parallel beta-helix repeat-containing protein [Kribbella sp.]